MANRTKLTELYVKFTVDGLRDAEDQTKRTAQRMSTTWSGIARQVSRSTRESIGQTLGSGLMGDVLRATNGAAAANSQAAGKSANSWSQFAKRVSSSFRSVMAGMFAMAAPVAGLWGFAKAAAEGTREGQNLGVAWEYLTQVIGSMFAPALRSITTGIVLVAQFLKELPAETKVAIVMIAAASAALVMLSGVAAAASVVFIALGKAAAFAWAMITAPVTLTIAVVVAAIALFSAGVAFMLGKLEEWQSGGKIASRSWAESMIAGVRIVVTHTMMAADMMIQAFAKAVNFITSKAAGLADAVGLDGLANRLRGLALDANKVKLPIGEVANLFRQAEAMIAKMPSGKELADRAKGFAKGLREIPGLIRQLFEGEMKFTPVMQVRFESLQQSFDRIQEAFAAGTQEDKLNKILEENKKAVGILDQILGKLGLGPPVPAVGN
jgi:hypothetical protein